MTRRVLTFTLSISIVISFMILSAIQGRAPYLTIGLATMGTLLCRSAVQRLHYPQLGGIVGGCCATLIYFKLYPLDRAFGAVAWIENLGLAFAVSVAVVCACETLFPKEEKQSM